MDDNNFQNSLCITSMKQKLSGPTEAHGPFIFYFADRPTLFFTPICMRNIKNNNDSLMTSEAYSMHIITYLYEYLSKIRVFHSVALKSCINVTFLGFIILLASNSVSYISWPRRHSIG